MKVSKAALRVIMEPRAFYGFVSAHHSCRALPQYLNISLSLFLSLALHCAVLVLRGFSVYASI